MANNIRTDKLDTCAALLEDCIVGFFAGNSIQTTTHLSFAVLTMVRDLSNHYKNTMKVDLNFTPLSERPKEGSLLKAMFQKSQFLAEGYNYSLIDRANFFKHANKDPLADNLFIGHEDKLALSIAVEDYSHFLVALTEKDLCCQVANLFELQNIQEPKVVKLVMLFHAYEVEYKHITKPFEDKRDYDSSLIAMDELKRKYSDIVHQLDLAKGRSQHDRLVLLDSLTKNIKPKPAAPARSQP